MLTPMKKRLIAGLTLLAVISAYFGASLVFPGKQASAENQTGQTGLLISAN